MESSPHDTRVPLDTSFRNQKLKAFPPLFFLFLAVWGIINIIQSLYTEIGDDEAYYWMYSQFPDWGYFDHPPMIALWIKAGSLLFEKELGVRFLTILGQLCTLALIWKLVGEQSPTNKKILLFFGIAASVVMFQVYGFIATPDSPLLFFTALFLAGYALFLQKETALHILIMAIAMAGLLYSKYHGALIIFFVILSNFRLLLNWKFWLAGMLAILALLPHILWQIQHEFPSLQYHLVSRARPVEPKHVLSFVPNQLLNFNPFFIGVVIYILIKYKPLDVFERALYFISIGFITFFFFMTFRGHVEPHWTIAASMGMMILLYRKSAEHAGIRKYVYRILFPSIALLIFARLAMMIDFLPVKSKFHGQREWCHHLSSIADGHPVVFRNTYQQPSVYTFYTGHHATTLNSIHYHKTQFELWDFESRFFGKKAVLVIGPDDPLATPHRFPRNNTVYLHHTDSFISLQKVKIYPDLRSVTNLTPGDSLILQAEFHNPYPHTLSFHHHEFPVTIHVAIIKDRKNITFLPATASPLISQLLPGEQKNVVLQVVVPDVEPGEYAFGILLSAGIIQEGFNSPLIPVRIKTGKD